MKDKSIAVIGAGIVGICCALSLQKQGAKVTLIDRKGIAAECSKGNAGHFACEQVFPLADRQLLWHLPAMLLKPRSPLRIHLPYLFTALPWFAHFVLNMRAERFEHNTQALRQLNEAAMAAYEPLLRDAGLNHLLVKKGSLLTFEKTSGRTIEQQYKKYRQQEVAVRRLSRKQALNLEPALSSNVKSALLFEDGAHTVDPELLCLQLAEHFEADGGQVLQQEVTALIPADDRIQLALEKGSANYERAVLCAGAWSKKLLSPLGYSLPLDTERGYNLTLPIRNPISRPIASAERRFIMTPMQKGLRLAGTVEFAGLERKMDPRRAAMLLPHAKELINDIPEKCEEKATSWMGMRPSLPDSLPVIGKATKHQNLYLAFGHQHLGLTQAAITGKLIAQQMCGESTDIDLKPYSISRFN